MSACASILSIFNNRNQFTCCDIDTILQSGDALYMSLKPYLDSLGQIYLSADELPTEIPVKNYAARIEIIYIDNGFFPKSLREVDQCLLALEILLEEKVFNSVDNPHNDNTDSIIFTGQYYTVSFWRFNGIYYFFNSHAVDVNNKPDLTSGVARLFKCNTLRDLAKLLFARGQYEGQYALDRLRVTNHNSVDEVSISSSCLESIFQGQLISAPSASVHSSSVTMCSAAAICTQMSQNFSIESESILKIQKFASLASVDSSLVTKSSDVNTNCTQNSHISNNSESILKKYICPLSVTQNNVTKSTDVTTNFTQNSHISNKSESILKRYICPLLVTQNNSYQSQSILQGLEFLPFSPVESSLVTATTKADIAQIQTTPESIITKTVAAIKDIKIPVVVLQKLDLQSLMSVGHFEVTATSTKTKKGRPNKVKRGPKSTKDSAHVDAVKKYNTKNRKKHQDAVKIYDLNNPEVHKKAAKKYARSNSESHQKSSKIYDEANPQVHRDSVNRSIQQSPEISKKTSATYNKTNRNVDKKLRKLSKLIGQMRDVELKLVDLYKLKKTSLLAPDTFKCEKCGAYLFEEERSRKQWCCGSGAYNVQKLASLTEEFYSHPSFVSRPRAYNNLFAFSALGVSHGYQHQDGISLLKIQGRIYHRVFDLAYTDSVNNLGLYIHDAAERENLAAQRSLDKEVITCIRFFLESKNPFIKLFRKLHEHTSDQAHIKFQQTTDSTDSNLLRDSAPGKEVAAIISTETEAFIPRCIAVWKVGSKKPHTVDIMHPCYESFQYPLLYPEGNAGWYPNKLDNRQHKLSQVKYVRCLLLSEPRFSQLGRLSEEWLVDMYCRISEERLRFIENFQKIKSNSALRSAPLQEVEMSIEIAQHIREDETIQGEGFVPGRVYLPSSFTGGPRYMKGKYSDAIAIVSRLGNPSFFLTFTCNPKWPEILQSTQSNSSLNNPLVCARVFNLKLNELLKDLRSGAWFGKIVYMIHVIEFQKRGLPHAHICFRVEGGGPVHNSDIDKFVRADIPEVIEGDGRLRTAVLNHMIHGPCGPSHRTDLPCWDNDKMKCSKYFPKRESDVTFCDDKGFIHFRRNSKNTANIKYRNNEVQVNDTWVVPYNASLLLKFDAHINLEVSTQRTVVKYLFKYITKGPDESRVTVVPDQHKDNEIEQYVTKRYIGSSDAAWRTLEFDVTARDPNVKQLSVHLENQQTIYFKPGTEAQAAGQAGSDLITYFNRPAVEEFESLTYIDFYERYIVHPQRPSTVNTDIFETTNNKFITKRQRGKLVARLFWVAPNRGEQFYLRILLKTYPCRSYAQLKNLGGPNCTTFQEAAKIVGLADDEVEYERAMSEANEFLTGPRLRGFFVLLAVNGVRVASIWETFKNELSEDIMNRLGNEDRDRAFTLCLKELSRMLRKHGSSLAEHGLPEVIDNTTELGRERLEYDRDALHGFLGEWLPRLSNEQRDVFDYVAKLCNEVSFRDTNSTALFVDGPAGTGKTLLLNVITAHVRDNLKGVVLCTASSAIAAQNHEGGVTAHSMFKFPLELVDDLGYWSITNGSQRAELISHADVIIYDEAPMAHKYLIHLLDRSLRDLMRNNKIFGGKIIIFAGDFRQIPPVVANARTNSDIRNASVKTSPIWRKLKTFTLATSQRCREDPEYAEFLLKLGSNRLPLHSITINNTTIKNFVNLSGIDIAHNLDDLINFVFTFLEEPLVCIHRAILTTRNDAVREINDIILERLPGDVLHFYSIDKVEDDNADILFLGPDALNRMQPKGLPEHDLRLKIGCICMIMRNLSFVDGLVNGTKVIVTDVSPRLITVQKSASAEPYLIPRIMFKAPIDTRSPFEMCRRQFPLQLCYAMTIHKSQGQTISRVGVDLRSDMFSHGQLYVALGRVSEKRHIKLLLHKDRILKDGKVIAKNVIIPELLQN